jgi:hypothetical protein
MKNALVLVAVLSILGLASQAHAVIPASCVRAPFPAMPTAPIFTATANNGAHQCRVDVWRLRCKIGNGSALLMRITPITVEPRVCSVDFIVEPEVEPAGVGRMPRQEPRLQGALRQTNNDNDSFCNILPTATTFAFETERRSLQQPGPLPAADPRELRPHHRHADSAWCRGTAASGAADCQRMQPVPHRRSGRLPRDRSHASRRGGFRGAQSRRAAPRRIDRQLSRTSDARIGSGASPLHP